MRQGKFPFVLESEIRHSLPTVKKHLKGLRKLNYNPYYWWRLYSDGNKPLGVRHHLLSRIENGDFDSSSYFWQAQLALYMAKDKYNPKDDIPTQLEKLKIDIARYKRLMQDYYKEENDRLEALYKAFTKDYKITKSELISVLENWGGDELVSFYRYMDEFYHTTEKANRQRFLS